MAKAIEPIWLPAGGNDAWMVVQQRQQRAWKLWPPAGHRDEAHAPPCALPWQNCQAMVIQLAMRKMAERL